MIHVFAAVIMIGVSHLISFFAMTELKYCARKTALIYFGYFVVFTCLSMLSYTIFGSSLPFYAISFTSTIIAALFVFMFISADPVCKKIFLFISYADFFSIFMCISLILSSLLFKDSSKIVVFYARNIIRTALFIPAAIMYMRFWRRSVRAVSGKNFKTWYSISIVSFLFLIVFALFVVIFNAEYRQFNSFVLLFTVAVLIYLSILWVIFDTVKSMIAESNTELIKQNVAYLQCQLKSAKENELLAKTVRHDFRHHNQNIEAMLKNGEIQEALNYLKQYNNSLDEARSNDFCSNVTVNAILNSFCTKTQKNGISVSVEADVTENTAISDMDFVAVLSNLLENAVNGCIECNSKGDIKVNIRTVADKTVIVCSNPCRNDISVENNMLKSRGIGIESMLSAIRKYDGNIKYSYDNESLAVCIILNS